MNRDNIRTPSLPFDLEKAIKDAINTRVEAAKETLIKEYIERFGNHIRGVVREVAVETAKMYSIERDGAELVIRVRIEDHR